ncbi:MAG: hypothetical protein E6I76_00145 [Chloroflexi bacterium]|nr:MAG: hypothetical protein E6I76_00145 [Chloroflexota bacterium]
MRLKLDENLPRHLAEHLAGEGHDVDTVGDEHLIGADDGAILVAATDAGRVLVTLDRGLGERALRSRGHRGVVVVRPPTQSASDVAATLAVFLAHPEPPDLDGAIAVVQASRMRIRRRS